jgi:hypothetical protein
MTQQTKNKKVNKQTKDICKKKQSSIKFFFLQDHVITIHFESSREIRETVERKFYKPRHRNTYIYAEFEVLMLVAMNSMVFWVVILCNSETDISEAIHISNASDCLQTSQHCNLFVIYAVTKERRTQWVDCVYTPVALS